MSVQQLSNLRSVTFTADSNGIQLDSLSIFPASLRICLQDEGTCLEAGDYYLDWQLGKLFIANESLHGITYTATFRVLPYAFKPSYSKKKHPGYSWKDSTYLDPYFYDPRYAFEDNTFDFGGLNYNGSFARGISFGNNQDLVVNSTLDLQLSGTIGDIEILAALTDNNIPIQPDGSTQQIQDFDKVYIQVTKGQHQFVAGDYAIKSRENYFVKFDKQLQGASYRTGFNFDKGWQTKHSASFAVARGKFSRNEFFGREGDQGPYRLTGINGETFIIILAGSERVFVDGRLLQRGENNEYIMDYNAGELVFTPNFMINRNHRVVVEFEYADQNYFRSLLHSGHSAQKGGLRLYAEIYSEQDSKNRPVLADVDSLGEAIMRSVGNNISQALVPGFSPADFNASRAQYVLRDTLVSGAFFDSVFVYSSDPDARLFDLSFSFVGQGNGNYSPVSSALNQRVYQWVAPVNGVPQGSFEPIILLITPKQDQYLVTGMDYRINAQTRVISEWSLSNRDPNSFSDIDNARNRGLASYQAIERTDTLGEKKWILGITASYELRTVNYQPPEQYRPVEFARDWNLIGAPAATEHFAIGRLNVINREHRFKAWAQVTSFQRQGIFSGFEQRYQTEYLKNNWDIRAEMRWTTSKDSATTVSFLRPTLHLGRTFASLRGLYVGVGGFTERNDVRNIETDTINARGYYFNNLYARVSTADTAAWTTGIEWRYRADFVPAGSNFQRQTTANDIELNGRANRLKNQTLNWRFTFRDFNVSDTLLIDGESDRNFLGRAEYGFRIKKGAVRFNALYELGSGQERVREFSYLEVPPGQGLYQWIDENGDGLQQLNEFVIAAFPDSARFVRLLTNVNEFIQARTVSYNQVIQLNPKAIWFNEEGIKKFISRLSVNSTTVLNRRTFKGAEVSAFNPFILNTTDEDVISLNSAFRNSLFFNQGSPKYYINYTWFLNQDKSVLVNGFETRRRQEQTVEINVNMVKTLSANLKVGTGRNSNTSELFTQNNFDLGIYKIAPVFTWLYQTKIRTAVGYEFENKLNPESLGGELARANKANFDFRYSQVGKQTIEAKFSFVNFVFTGVAGTTKAFQILEGLQPGRNFIWSLNYDRNLSNNLQLNLAYEGRKTGNNGPIIHTGRAALRALF
jgi:hypothetical protein